MVGGRLGAIGGDNCAALANTALPPNCAKPLAHKPPINTHQNAAKVQLQTRQNPPQNAATPHLAQKNDLILRGKAAFFAPFFAASRQLFGVCHCYANSVMN